MGKKYYFVFSLLFYFLLSPAVAIRGDDTEGCLVCHRYRGLGRLDEKSKSIRLFYVNPTYYSRSLGAHSLLKCTDCHERSEVQTIPHKPVSPVHCTRSCHLLSNDNIEKHFAHKSIQKMLVHSVHTEEVLNESNRILDSPLSPGQARCLLCHDEPTYRRGQFTWVQQEAPLERCNVCHNQQLPVDAQHYYWHIHARSRPAWSNQEMVRNCAVCHANLKVLKKFDLPNSIDSYLASFHGKGTLLGDEQTADCLDCHTDALQNVHQMVSHTKDSAPTNKANIDDTCRSPKCHPFAGKKVGSASIHLDLSTSRGIEFFIAALFVLLIVFTFGPSAVLTILDMFHIALGRHDSNLENEYQRVARLMKSEEGKQLLQRFSPLQRVQHWVLVVCFTTLVVTGFPMKFADTAWAAWLIEKLGGLNVARLIHRIAGAMLITGFIFHLVVYVGSDLWRRKKQSGKGFIHTFLNMPLVMSLSDFKKMGQYILFLLFLRKTRPKWGRFSLEEKFEYFGVLWGTVILGVTGILMWNDALTTRYLPGRVLTVANLIHGFEAYLALLHVGIVHLAGVLLKPAVFPCSPAMFTGNTPIEEMVEIHSLMIDEAEKKLESSTLTKLQPDK